VIPIGTYSDDVYEYESTEVVNDVVPSGRRVVLTPASAIAPRRARWLWSGRVAVGTLALLAGREGLGKSTLTYWTVAALTRGLLPGEHEGEPRDVLVCATEDSWAHTIVPRLIAAGADLDRVHQVEVVEDDLHTGLKLPVDLDGLATAVVNTRAVLLVLDPLMSRLDVSLDSHKDADVRHALEPLVRFADGAGIAVIGLIHLNKSATGDVLDRVMASRAFTAVARSVSVVTPDPDDDTGYRRLFGTPKNNLGRSDLPTLVFTIEGAHVTTTDGPAETSKVVFLGETDTTIQQAMSGEDHDEARTKVAEATAWLQDYMAENGPTVKSATIKKDARRVDIGEDALKRARRKLGLAVVSEGFPKITHWGLSQSGAVGALATGGHIAAPTAPTALTDHQSAQSVQSVQSGETGTAADSGYFDGEEDLA
jgi:hypothetical protein